MYREMERLLRLILVGAVFMTASGSTLADAPASLHSSLCVAITKGDLVQVKRLLAKGADPNARGRDGQTPLTLAAKLTRTEIGLALLAKGADPYRVNTDGWNALLVACVNMQKRSRDDQEMLDRPERVFIHKILQAEAQRHKLPLIGAVEAEDLQAVQKLLASGTNPDEHDAYGGTALMWAAYQGNQDICKALVTHGAHINRQDKDGYSALMLAASSATLPSHCHHPYLSFLTVDHTPVVEDLLAAGADPNLKDRYGMAALANAGRFLYGLGFNHAMCMALIQHGAHVDVAGYGDKSLLEIAGYVLDKELLATLLDLHPTQADKDAALASVNSFRFELVTMNSFQLESFHKARLECVQRLLKAGANVSVADRSGVSILSLALVLTPFGREAGNEIVRLLMAAGADVNARRGVEMTSLMIAVEFAGVESVRALLKQGAQVNARAIRSGRTITALSLARSHNATEVVKILEEAGAK